MKKVLAGVLVAVALVALVSIIYYSSHDKDPNDSQASAPSSTSAPAPAPAPVPSQGASAPVVTRPPHANLSLSSGAVTLDAAPLADGQARFYTVALAGKSISFFVVKDGAGTYRAAADACDVCFAQKRGFHQEGSEIVCNNCGNRYPLSLIATQKGGCNPGPINANLQAGGGSITINQAELQQVSQLF